MDAPPARLSLISLCSCAWSPRKVWNRPGKSLKANFRASPGSVGASVIRSNPKFLMTCACLSKASRKGPTSRLFYLLSQSWIDFIPSLCQIRCFAAYLHLPCSSPCAEKSCVTVSLSIKLHRVNKKPKSTTLRIITSHYMYFCVKTNRLCGGDPFSVLLYVVTRDNAPYHAEKILLLYHIL